MWGLHKCFYLFCMAQCDRRGYVSLILHAPVCAPLPLVSTSVVSFCVGKRLSLHCNPIDIYRIKVCRDCIPLVVHLYVCSLSPLVFHIDCLFLCQQVAFPSSRSHQRLPHVCMQCVMMVFFPHWGWARRGDSMWGLHKCQYAFCMVCVNVG